ncbi:MAG: thioredoxin fold domain-containing protein [Endozoicomonadaceae bacterium]|nr:thioredoxin fold domain-containing protein [Endozoicomonadaceae bacterium]
MKKIILFLALVITVTPLKAVVFTSIETSSIIQNLKGEEPQKIEPLLNEALGVVNGHLQIKSFQRLGVSSLYKLVLKSGGKYIIDNTGAYWMPYQHIKEFEGGKALQVTPTATEHYNQLTLLKFLDQINLITYPAYNSKKDVLYAFIDISCPYCRKFHQRSLRKLNKIGVEVRYVPLLRDIDNKKIMEMQLDIFCSKDINSRTLKMDSFIGNFKAEQSEFDGVAQCNKHDRALYTELMKLGQRLDFIGSPAFLTQRGRMIYGESGLSMYFASF